MNVPETFFTVEEELRLFLFSCIAGVVFGVYYDIFRTLRLMLPHSRLFVLGEDILFLGTYALFLSSFASAAARGELRGYYILGSLIGFSLYFFTVGKAVIRLMERLMGIIRAAFAIAVKPFKYATCKFVGCSKNFVKSNKNDVHLLQNKSDL